MIWEKVRLDDICEINMGKTPSRSEPKYWDGNFPWVSIADLKGDYFISKTKEGITEFAIKNSGVKIVPKNTLLYSFKLSIGKVAITKNEIYTNEAIAAFPIKDKTKVDLKYLYWAVQQIDLEGIGDKAVKGITLNKEKLKELQIPLPPLPIQKRIAEILDAADELKRKDNELLNKYDELAQSIFIDMFGDPVRNEKGWEKMEFGSCIEYIGDIGSNGSNATISKNIEMLDTEDYAIMIRTTNLNANNFEKNLKYVSKKTYDFFSKSQIFGGEIIMNKIGSAGDFWIMPHLNKPVSLGLNQLVIRLKNLNSKYLYYYLSTNYSKAKIKASINGAVTKSITKSAVKSLPLLYPKLDLQNKFSEIVSLIEKQKNKSSTIQVNQLFKSIIQKAFKGELTT